MEELNQEGQALFPGSELRRRLILECTVGIKCGWCPGGIRQTGTQRSFDFPFSSSYNDLRRNDIVGSMLKGEFVKQSHSKFGVVSFFPTFQPFGWLLSFLEGKLNQHFISQAYKYHLVVKERTHKNKLMKRSIKKNHLTYFLLISSVINL